MKTFYSEIEARNTMDFVDFINTMYFVDFNGLR